MAPKRIKSEDPHGMFSVMVVFLAEDAVQPRRLQVWKAKADTVGSGGGNSLAPLSFDDSARSGWLVSKDLYLLVANCTALDALCGAALCETNILNRMLLYPWLEETLRSSGKVQEEAYDPRKDLENPNTPQKSPDPKAAEVAPAGTDYSSDYLELRCRSQATSNAIDREVSSQSSSSIYGPPDLNRNINEIFGKLINIYRALAEERR